MIKPLSSLSALGLRRPLTRLHSLYLGCMDFGGRRTYLETTYEVANGKELSHRLKNANETESKIWRYHHYNSRLDYTTKRAILFSTLRKVHKMASNSKQLHISAIAKCKEYIKLHYPVGILKYMCSIMARETANHIWLQVRREL